MKGDTRSLDYSSCSSALGPGSGFEPYRLGALDEIGQLDNLDFLAMVPMPVNIRRHLRKYVHGTSKLKTCDSRPDVP